MVRNSSLTNIPTVLIILGATGDLTAKKIVPALYHLFREGELPRMFKVIGFARRDLSDADFRERVVETLKRHPGHKPRLKEFQKLFSYARGHFEFAKDYHALAKTLKDTDDTWGVCSNKLFYLAVPPSHYKTIFTNLHASGLTEQCSPAPLEVAPARAPLENTASSVACNDFSLTGRERAPWGPQGGLSLTGWTPLEIVRLKLESKIGNNTETVSRDPQKRSGESLTGWTRVIVEKPFGYDEKSAKALDMTLARLFKEDQIYRIDHYLAKEMLQNILAFRFANNLFEDNWGRDLVEKISVRLLEKIGVEDRGAFYDKVGALRDVGQNHLLQMVALVTMDKPQSFSSEAIRNSRAEILKSFALLTAEEARRNTFRAQYNGYRNIKGVSPRSKTETYFKAKFFLDSPRWQGVPIVVESGKRLGEPVKEIEITFAHPLPCLCPFALPALNRIEGSPVEGAGQHYKNSLLFHLEPKEGITIRFWVKKPGFKMELEERTFNFEFRKSEKKSQYTEEYEKLLLDCIAGDQTLFVSSEEVFSMWRFIDPITRAWEKNAVPLRSYKPNAKHIVEEASFIDAEGASYTKLKKEIGIMGLGKMGGNVARQLKEKRWRVVASNRSREPIKEIENEGIEGAYSLEELVKKLSAPRIIWLMITAGKAVDDVLKELVKHLKKGDVVIDAGNSFYEDSVRRAKSLAKGGIRFMDVGFSGGPAGARNGGSLMIGGEKKTFDAFEGLFADLAVPGGYQYCGKAGAGHFVKMVHNGIEYGMMQALAEGFAVLKKSPFKPDLKKIADIYNHGSVIESRLVGWLESGLRTFGEDLKNVSGSVAATGEGEWTVKTAKKLKVPVPIIEGAFKFRKKSWAQPSYIGKILSALRNQFGGHEAKIKTEKSKIKNKSPKRKS